LDIARKDVFEKFLIVFLATKRPIIVSGVRAVEVDYDAD
jgi:hypothetical protein